MKCVVGKLSVCLCLHGTVLSLSAPSLSLSLSLSAPLSLFLSPPPPLSTHNVVYPSGPLDIIPHCLTDEIGCMAAISYFQPPPTHSTLSSSSLKCPSLSQFQIYWVLLLVPPGDIVLLASQVLCSGDQCTYIHGLVYTCILAWSHFNPLTMQVWIKVSP